MAEPAPSSSTDGGRRSPVIVSSRTFRSSQGEMKRLAQTQPVHVTDNGAGAYVFCSEDVFRREVERRADELRYEREVERAVALGMDDLANGRVFEGSPAQIMTEAARRARERA